LVLFYYFPLLSNSRWILSLPHNTLESLSQLHDIIDLDKVIVISGFGEVGPWGSSRTRWEMEAKDRLTLEGCIEMAWMMGYIKHSDRRLKDGTLHVGWVDAFFSRVQVFVYSSNPVPCCASFPKMCIRDTTRM